MITPTVGVKNLINSGKYKWGNRCKSSVNIFPKK